MKIFRLLTAFQRSNYGVLRPRGSLFVFVNLFLHFLLIILILFCYNNNVRQKTRRRHERIRHNVKKSILKDSARSAHVVMDNYKSGNPLLMRKKFLMKDVYYRRDDPDTELLRFEFAFDVEQYVLVAAAVCVLVMIAMKMSSFMKRMAVRRSVMMRRKRKRK